MEFRKGDVVKFEGVVAFAAAGQVYFEGSNTASLPAASVELVRRPFKVGERIYVEGEGAGVIIATLEDEAWIKFDDGSGASTWQLSECVPEPIKPAEPDGARIVDGLRVDPPKPDGDDGPQF